MRNRVKSVILAVACFLSSPASAALNIPITVNLSESVNVTGTPQIAVDVGGTTRQATYTSGTGTNALTFTLSPQAGDVDLDGVTVSSPIQLNGGTIKDSKGNDAVLTFTPPNTANVKVNYPSLGMDFIADADGRYTLNGTPYNDLSSFLTATGGSFTRASIGTYFDSTGTLQTAAANTPRFDYDPITHAQKGILLEASRTNALKYSDQFDNALWIKTYLYISANITSAPDGTMSAEKLYEDSSTNVRYIYINSMSFTSGTAYTLSFFVKPAGRSRIGFFFPSGSFGASSRHGWFDLSTGTIGGLQTGLSGLVTPLSNGWFRCALIGTPSTTGTGAVGIYLTQGGFADSYTGDGSSGVYIWGGQLEQGPFPTSYISTTTAAVTRGADMLTIPTGSWYNPTTGTGFAEFIPTYSRFDKGIFSFYTSSGDFTDTRTNSESSTYVSGGTTEDQFAASMNILSRNKIAKTIKLNDFSVSLNGGTVITDTSSATPSVTTLRVGGLVGNSSWGLNGTIQKFKYYPARVPNTHLQLLTQ